MSTRLPGTTIEVSEIKRSCSRIMFDGIFAAGGITLSQVSVMTDLEPHVIQNWVKRGFVSSPKNRQYSKSQFARIVVINMLRESLQLDSICSLLSHINGDLKDRSDDLIDDCELYHKYVDMLADGNINVMDEACVNRAVEGAVCDVYASDAAKKKQLCEILRAMLYAHTASELRGFAAGILSDLH